ncbi:MAG: CHAT domain-containing tetratricopeptide repeat protein [candidate division WOR-3 bacterium]
MDELSKLVLELVDKFSESEDFIKAVEDKYSHISEKEKGDLFLEIGIRLYNFSYFRLAIEVLNKALSYYFKYKDKAGEGKCYTNLGEAYRNLGEFYKSIEYQEKALEIFKEIGDRRGEGDCYRGLGNAYFFLGDFYKSIEYLEKALEIFKEIGDRRGEVKCYIGLGNAYNSLGEFGKSIEFYNKSLEIRKTIGDRLGEGACYTNLGTAYYSLGDFYKSIEYYNKALDIDKEIGYRQGESKCYRNLGNAYLSLGDFYKSIEYYNKALDISKTIGDRRGEGACYTNLGTAYYFLGDFYKSIEYYNKALDIFKAIGDRLGEGACYINLGEVYRNLGEFYKSIEYQEKALEICKEIGDIYGEKICLDNLGWIYLGKEDYLKAEEYFEEGIKKYEELTRDKLPKDPKERKDFLKGSISLFDGMVITQIKLGNKEKALEYSEMGKGRTILDFIIYKGIEKEEVKQSLNFQRIKDLAKEIGRTILLFRITEKGSYTFIIKPRDGFEFITIPEFNSKRLDEIMVKYEDNKPVDGWVYRYSKYKNMVSNFVRFAFERGEKEAKEILEKERDNWFNTLKPLYEELLAEVFEGKIFEKGEKIVIIPNKGLNILPIHACQKEDGKYLIDEYEITYAPNCSLLDLCYRREKERKRDSFFAIANPTGDIPFSETEVKEIEKLFINKEIHRERIVKDILLNNVDKYNIIHFSTHGTYHLGSAFNSLLYLGVNEYLTLSEIFEKVKLPNSWLVSLSACETALIDYRDIADESIGLHTGFLYAGAPTVIATLWTVADISTALIMIRTYDNIFNKNMGKGEALRKAQLWLKEATKKELIDWAKGKSSYILGLLTSSLSLFKDNDKPFSHPYYWSGFQCFGTH